MLGKEVDEAVAVWRVIQSLGQNTQGPVPPLAADCILINPRSNIRPSTLGEASKGQVTSLRPNRSCILHSAGSKIHAFLSQKKKKKKKHHPGVPGWLSRLRIQCRHCCGLRISKCQEHGQKIKHCFNQLLLS